MWESIPSSNFQIKLIWRLLVITRLPLPKNSSKPQHLEIWVDPVPTKAAGETWLFLFAAGSVPGRSNFAKISVYA
jgi:hypothetical protein